MSEEKIYIDGIGEIQMSQLRQSRSLRISIDPMRGVLVTMPMHVSFIEAHRFILLKKDWIVKNLLKIKSSFTKFDYNSTFNTRTRQLKIIKEVRENVNISVDDNFIIVKCPEQIDINTEKIQQFIRKAIETVWYKEAKVLLPKRLQFLAQRYGFTFNKVSVRKTTSRWGSCNHVNYISLNFYILQLPDHLIDYVLLHELAHTVEKNHGKNYWAVLDKIMGKSKFYDKQLNNYQIGVY